MKKIFLLGALVSIIVSSTIVFATDSLTQTGTTLVKYGVDEGYTLTIPPELSLSTTAEEKELSVTNVRLAAGERLTVSMESKNYTADASNKYHVVYDSDSIIPYTVKKGAKGAVNTEVTENNHTLIDINAGDTAEEIYLTFTTTDENIAGATKGGLHTDTLTFTASVTTTGQG